MGVALRNQKVHLVYRLGEAGPGTLSIDEDIGEQFAAISIDRWEAAPRHASPATRQGCMSTPNPFACALRTLQFGHMSVTVEKQMVHETKGDTVAPGNEGLLNLDPSDFVFYVGGYPSNFTVSPAGPAGCPSCHTELLLWVLSGVGRRPDLVLCPQPPEPLRFPRYRGCIELDTLNEAVISLYNFEKTFLLNTAVDKPCARCVWPGDP